MNIFEYLAAQHSIIERGKSKTVQEITDGAAEVNNAYIMVPQATGLLVLLLDFVIINFRSKPHGVFCSRVTLIVHLAVIQTGL